MPTSVPALHPPPSIIRRSINVNDQRRLLAKVMGVVVLHGLTTLCGLINCTRRSTAQESAAYFEHQVQRIEQATIRDLAEVNADNWPEIRRQWRDELRDMLGLSPEPDRTQLRTTVVGSIRHPGMTIDRLHYQSRPGLFVTANLYRPDEEPPAEGWPAVLYVCGHARVNSGGRLLGNKTAYHHHGMWFARHGVVCLMIDTVQLGELQGEHHGTYKLGRWDWISRGYTPAGVEAWNAIRGVDLLSAMPDVDATRIGITGRSGGGAYSWFAAALDERIRVAVPVAGITDLRNHVVDGCVEGHCDCMYFVNLYGWDYAKLAALVAPRALLLENSDTDRIFPLDGVVRVDRQLRDLYQRLDAASQYGLVITPGPHKDTQDLRVPAFRWLLKHLTDQSITVDSPADKELEPGQLAVFERETPAKEHVTDLSSWFVTQAAPIRDSELAWREWSTSWKPRLAEIGVLPSSLPSAEFQQLAAGQLDGHAWKLLEARPTGTATIQVLQVEGASDDAASSAAVAHLRLQDTTRWHPSRIEQLLGTSWIKSRLDALPNRVHYFVRPRCADWLEPEQDARRSTQLVRRFYLLGQTPEQLALHDYLTSLGWISNQLASEQRLRLVGSGRDALLTVLAGLWSLDQSALSAIDGLLIQDFPNDPMLCSCLPALLRTCHPDSLRVAAQQHLSVQQLSGMTDDQRLLVDTSQQPQQANGMRIVEVTQQQATIWVRATRWPLPNLGDLPEVEFHQPDGKHSSGAILPETGVAGLRYGVPGVEADVRVSYRKSSGGDWQHTEWQPVSADTDYSALVKLPGLLPDTHYQVRTSVRGNKRSDLSSTLSGSFKTLPAPGQSASFRLAVSTCQSFPDRDGAHGFDLYRTMRERRTDAFVMAGDVVYYDRLARSRELANYHWQRTYGLPTLVEFHCYVPTYFLKDDHDTYVNDSWPGSRFAWTDRFTFEQGQQIFIQQTGLPDPAYRTFRLGQHLQIWLMEGRDFRSPNNAPDGPDKSIWGAEQKQWLADSLGESQATFKVVISPTPLVGPDRNNKRDNHANRVFETEGQQVRSLIASVPNAISVCGDRHWQFHSIDPATGLHEFSVGPASERHAGGWKQSDFRPDVHQFLRVGGGYLELDLDVRDDQPRLILKHLDTHGHEHHRHEMN